MRKDLAESFSLSFHPIFVTFYIVLFIFVMPIFTIQSLGSSALLSILVLIAISTVILPIGSMYYLKRKGIIQSFEMHNKNERATPYIYTAIYYATTAYMLYRIDFIPKLIPLILIIPAVVIIMLLVLNTKLKVSAHAAGMGSLNAIIYVLMQIYYIDLWIPLFVSFVLSFSVLFSRKYLKAHSYLELLLGYMIGGIVSLGIGFWGL